VGNLPSPQNDISYSQSTDCTPEKVIKKQNSERRVLIKKEILFPELHPRKDYQKQPHFEAVDNVD
jgi:hypothetical protein